MSGTLDILDGEGPPIRVVIETAGKGGDHATCFVSVHPVREADGVLRGTALDPSAHPFANECAIAIAPVNAARLRVTATGCEAVCGVHARFDGDYRRVTR